MKNQTRILNALSLFALLGLAACTNGTSAPKKSTLAVNTQNGSLLNTDSSKIIFPTPVPLKPEISSATFTAGANALQVVMKGTSLDSKVYTTATVLCKWTWTEQLPNLSVSSRSAQTAVTAVNGNQMTCSLPADYAQEVIAAHQLAADSIPSAGIQIVSSTASTTTITSSVFPLALPASTMGDGKLDTISRAVCFSKKRLGGQITNAYYSQEINQSYGGGFQNDPLAGNYVEASPVLFSNRFCFEAYSGGNDLRRTDGVRIPGIASPTQSNSSTPILCVGKDNGAPGTSSTDMPRLKDADFSRTTYPLHFYSRVTNPLQGDSSSKDFECLLVGGTLSRTQDFRLNTLPNREYTISVAARSCIAGASGNCRSAPNPEDPCASITTQQQASNTSTGTPVIGCLGFAKQPETDRCTPDSNGNQTYSLRRYVALYAPEFDVNGYPLPNGVIEGSYNSQGRNKIENDTIYVLDRPATDGTGIVRGPLPCPFAIKDENDKDASGVEAWKMISELETRTQRWLPMEDKIELDKTVTNTTSAPREFRTTWTPKAGASCGVTLPIPFDNAGDLNAWFTTLAHAGATAHSYDSATLPEYIADDLIQEKGLLVRKNDPFGPVYIEDRNFKACAPAVADKNEWPAILQSSGTEYCSLPYKKSVTSPALSTSNDAGNFKLPRPDYVDSVIQTQMKSDIGTSRISDTPLRKNYSCDYTYKTGATHLNGKGKVPSACPN